MKYIKTIRKRYIPNWGFSRPKGEEKVFCISMQRTGTTSVGNFFRDFGFKWAGWPADKRNKWSLLWYEGNYEAIFNSLEFKSTNAYEDSPWFMPGFYKVLYHRFPGAKFILFTRDADAWFQSMIKHSKGNVLGRSRVHAKIYRREEEFYQLLQDGAIDEAQELQNRYDKTMKILPDHAGQYKSIYNLHNLEIQEFFQQQDPNALFVAALEDPEKWRKLGNFLGIAVPTDYESFENKSNLR